ncbi:hypothetical protein EW146_g1884 [Bondarzewia mesenterica]|uniref:Metal resistance protein YCF1 n=1 Tax=Bondarzewia mesenterica TaxID=1095465 RepID=A0A4S4M299_9AGAM|nr:hypothetical protein EW146_g1884 [Bondarzewia mesenterica]
MATTTMHACRDAEGWGPLSRLRQFDLTPCFEEGIILPIPLIVLLVTALFRIWSLRSVETYQRAQGVNKWLLNLKLVLLELASLTSLANLILILALHQPVAIFQTYILEVLALNAASLLTYFNHTRTRTSSTILLLFWPVYLLILTIWSRTVVLKGLPNLRLTFVLKWATAGLGLFAFALECLGPEYRRKALVEETGRAIGEHPLVTANIFSKWNFGWMTPLMKKGVTQFITENELPPLLSADESANLGYRLRLAMKNHKSLWTSLFVAYGGVYVQAAGLKVIQDCLAFLQPQLLRLFLVYISSYQSAASEHAPVTPSPAEGFAIVAVMFIASMAQTITLAFISLYNLLGWAAFVGVAIMIISIPFNTMFARFLKKLQETQMKNRDKRTRLMSELLANIKSIKLYAWEHAFVRRILFVRNDLELKMMRKIGIYTALNVTIWSGIPLLVAFSSFATAALTSSKPLTSDIVFPAMSLFMLLTFPMAMFSQVTSSIIEAMVSVNRLSSFLHADELQPDARKISINSDLRNGDIVLRIEDGEFTWSKEALSPTLEDINLTVRKGELVGILGRVGAGKTSLLSAIIGELQRTDGEVVLNGHISYAPQNPWIMSASIRDNILFSHEYDEVFYNIVLEACALRPDLALMPEGDLTEVGERGITLSGGQRARVSLARAVYARADLTLLDDVLAAVDSHVARHVFDRVIGPQGILATKARILVTNSLAFLSNFDQILYLRRGIVIESGPYVKLMADNESELSKLIRGHGNSGSSGTVTPYARGESSSYGEMTTPGTPTDETTLTPEKIETLAEKLTRKTSFRKAVLAQIPPAVSSSEGPRKEQSAQGRVKAKVYSQYLEAASRWGFGLFLIATLLQQALSILANVSLKSWGEHNRESGSNAQAGRFLLLYGGLSLSSTVLGAVAAIVIWVLCALRSSKKLHDSMLNSVIRAPLTFFELTPSGRIMNLFSRDTYVVDQILARVIQSLVRTAASCAGIVVVIGASFPLFLIAVVPLGWLYRRVMIYYLATSRELKRLDAVSRSPIFAWFSESLNGVSTIRAFDQQAVFSANNERRIDRNQMCYLPSISVNRWLAIRLEFVGAAIILVAATLSMIGLITTGVDAGLVGLVLSYALNTTTSLNWVVRSASEVEQNIVSVERIQQYIELEPEAPYELPDSKPPEDWPSKGGLEFSEYSLRYRPELDLALKNITLTIKPSEKIGVCGRTGAGKSSLLLALFRTLEPASGTIFIDGVDITKIGLHDLRSALSIVPQSPDLFEGTMRENVDPVGEYQDADIWVALSQCHLKEFVENLPEGLDAPVREGGSSLSAGQRQLICFARALLRKSKILVLDEATSAVDLETDKAIQEIIRGPQFEHVTMLIIAHRLNTIIDSDRVLVLDAGEVAEFDAPQTLLEKPESRFRSLAVEAGLAQ